MFPTNTDLDGGFDIFGAGDAVSGFCKMRCIGQRVKDSLQQEGLQECEGSRSLARHLSRFRNVEEMAQKSLGKCFWLF
jgi:hypothetical protein